MTSDLIIQWRYQAARYASQRFDIDIQYDEWCQASDELFAQLARADERERCAKLCDGLNEQAKADECAAAIRSRKGEE